MIAETSKPILEESITAWKPKMIPDSSSFLILSVIVGTEDNDPNAASLRHTDEAELQGAHRLARAEHFFNESQNIANQLNSPFNWQFQTVANVGHQYNIMAGVASELLYN